MPSSLGAFEANAVPDNQQAASAEGKETVAKEEDEEERDERAERVELEDKLELSRCHSRQTAESSQSVEGRRENGGRTTKCSVQQADISAQSRLQRPHDHTHETSFKNTDSERMGTGRTKSTFSYNALVGLCCTMQGRRTESQDRPWRVRARWEPTKAEVPEDVLKTSFGRLL